MESNLILFLLQQYNSELGYKVNKYHHNLFDIEPTCEIYVPDRMNGPIITKWKRYDKYHRIDEPAFIIFFNDVKYEKCWYINGKLHRNEGPAKIKSSVYGRTEEWFINGLHNRQNDEPSLIKYNRKGIVSEEKWFINGLLDRENDKPSTIKYNHKGIVSTEIWCKNGKLHREDKPAQIHYYINKSIKLKGWYKNGNRHRENGPAQIQLASNGTRLFEYWFIDGRLTHREEYFIHGKPVNRSKNRLSTFQRGAPRFPFS
jgi:hypothetical protein